MAARRRQRGGGQRGGGVGSAAVVAAEWWQPGGGSAGAAARRRQRGGGGSAGTARRRAAWRRCRQCGSGSVSGGSKAAGAALPPRATMVATKTPTATAMAGALTTINNQLHAQRAAAAAMFPLFITHDEYFLRCGGSGGGGTMFQGTMFSTKFLVDKNSIKYGVHTNIVPRKNCEGYKKQCLWTGPYS